MCLPHINLILFSQRTKQASENEDAFKDVDGPRDPNAGVCQSGGVLKCANMKNA